MVRIKICRVICLLSILFLIGTVGNIDMAVENGTEIMSNLEFAIRCAGGFITMIITGKLGHMFY